MLFRSVIATVDGTAVTTGEETAIGNYLVTTVDGTLTINRKAVTITAKDASKTYDGRALTESGFTASDLEEGDSHTFTVVMTADSTITDYKEGGQPNVIATVDGTAVTTGTETIVGNYLVTTVDGTLTINKKPITITAIDQTYTYNATSQGENDVTYTDSEQISVKVKVTIEDPVQGEELTSITLDGQETNAGEYTGKIVPSAAVIGANTDNYDITYVPGTLTINKAKLTITADNKRKGYGAVDPELTVTPEGLQGEDSIDSITITREEGYMPGTYAITAKDALLKNADGEDVTSNYDIEYVDGTFTIIKPVPPTPDLNSEDHIAFVQGYPDGTVHPEGYITRAETATMVYRLLTDERRDEIFTTQNDFSDVEKTYWYNKAVSSMENGDYITGYPDGTFKGDQTITRAEFVTIMVRFLSGPKAGNNPFSDIDNHWAKDYIITGVQAGWIDGYPDGTFRPDDPIKRSEAMKIMNCVLNRGVDETSELGDYTNFPDNSDANKWYYYEVIEAANNHETKGHRPDEDWTRNTVDHVYDIDKYERP